MREHVRILGYLNIVMGALGLLAAIVIAVIFGGAIGIVNFAAPYDADAQRVAIPIIGIVGIAIFALVLLLSLPGIIAGVGLLQFQSWARILTIVLSALNLLNVPIGTALGIYGLWVLLQAETERLFEASRGATPSNTA